MRVNITYSVDLEKIPSEVNRLLEETEMSLDSLTASELKDIRELINIDQNYAKSIEKIDEARLGLLKSISLLEDCSGILLSYVEVLHDQQKDHHEQMLLSFGPLLEEQKIIDEQEELKDAEEEEARV